MTCHDMSYQNSGRNSGRCSSIDGAWSPCFSFGKVPSSFMSSGGAEYDKEAAKVCAKANRALRDTILGLPCSVTDVSMAVKKYRRFAVHQIS
jgi:hypothetical protein